MKRLLILTSLTLALSACSQSPSAPSAAPAPETPAPGTLSVSGQLSGQTVKGKDATVSIKAQTLSEDGVITVLKTSDVPKLPPVAVVNSSYVIGQTPGVQAAGGWRVKANVPEFRDVATLTLNSATLRVQSGEMITELFVRNEDTGDISLVGTYRQQASLVVESFADQLNELRGDADLTYFALTAPLKNYVSECKEQGGDTDLGYCSFRNKVLPSPARPALGAQALTPQAGTPLNVVSYNIGNVAVSCSAFRYKVCYQSTERKISDQILSNEYTYGKPAVVFLQEAWHGDCRNIGSSWNWGNPRLCNEPTRGVRSADRILGNRYSTVCTTVTAANNDPRNGYECTGIDTNQVYWMNTNYIGAPDGSGLHPFCASTDKWQDTGFQVTRIGRPLGDPIVLVNTHLAGTVDNACRADQIRGLATELRSLGKPTALIAGDFNTEPYNDSKEGGIQFRREFVTPFQYEAVDPVGFMIDPGNVPSTRYVYGTPALDHAVAYGLNGSCAFDYYYDGTDHALMRCSVY